VVLTNTVRWWPSGPAVRQHKTPASLIFRSGGSQTAGPCESSCPATSDPVDDPECDDDDANDGEDKHDGAVHDGPPEDQVRWHRVREVSDGATTEYAPWRGLCFLAERHSRQVPATRSPAGAGPSFLQHRTAHDAGGLARGMSLSERFEQAKTTGRAGCHARILRAGEGNRTPVPSLGSSCSTIELHPRIPADRAVWSDEGTRPVIGAATRNGAQTTRVRPTVASAGRCPPELGRRARSPRCLRWLIPGRRYHAGQGVALTTPGPKPRRTRCMRRRSRPLGS